MTIFELRKTNTSDMKVINLGETNSVLNSFVAQMRDKTVQKDRERFRNNLEKLGNIFAYELSKTLNYKSVKVETPLGISEINVPSDKLVIATILRAGLPLHKGILDFFREAECAFVAAFRKYDRGDDFHVNVEYATSPSLSGKTLILADTMLATGTSIEVTYNKLAEDGEPDYLHLVCPIASVFAIEYLQKHLRADKVTLWTAAIDEELTSQSYIVPGLGDAGDLCFGKKL